MNRLLFVLFFVVGITAVVNAATLVKSAVTTEAGTYAVSASSTTATLARSADVQRRGIEFYNNGTVTVYVSTYAATSTTNLYPVGSGNSFSDNIEAYKGDWYVMTEAGNSSQNVRIIEKTSSNY